jgi:hypothetical protein
MRTCILASLLTVAGLTETTSAFILDCQWWHHVGPGPVDFAPVPATGLVVTTPGSVRLRLRLGLFDDSPIPDPGFPGSVAGGIVGWNFGSLMASGECIEQFSRTPGRLAPYNFLPSQEDPLVGPVLRDELLSGIDASMGTQSPFWGCDANGVPLPQPQPIIRGLDGYVSLYEITLQVSGVGPASVTALGMGVAASTWFEIGEPIPPDCSDPANPIPGSVTYAPLVVRPSTPISCTAEIICIPTPTGAGLLVLSFVFSRRRRR